MACYKNFVVFYFSVFVLLGCVRIVSGINNPPRFTIGTRFFPVPEDTPKGTVLFNISARDTDPGTSLTFGLETDDKTVKVGPAFSIGNDEWAANVTLNARLDRDNGPSRKDLYFTVSEGGYTVKASLAIVITDVNDNPPTFTDLPYRISVPENFSIKKTLYQFNGTDPDSGTGARIVFSMKASIDADEEDYNATFHLDGAQGVVKLKKSLDYETRSFYHFKVTAKDEGNPPCPGADCLCNKTDYTTDYCDGPTVDFFITVVDVEDTPPVFERLPYHGTVSENQTVNTVILTAKARDGDRAVESPSKIVYSLSGDQSGPFSVNPIRGEISIKDKLDADNTTVRERGGLYVFNLTATESSSSETTSTLVSITVTDSNDNAPEFKNKTFFATVLENTPKGAPITMTSTIEVEDIDQSENSQFKISVMTMDGEPDTDFTTIPKAGQILQGSTSVTIIVNNSTILDYETCKNISFKLVAREVIGTGNSKQDGNQRSEAEVHITIEDTNDNSPVFAAGQTKFHVSEDAAIGHVIHTFSATDEDSGAFGRMVFSMETGQATPMFNVADNGSLMVAGEFQYELQSSYIIVVTATDNPEDHDSQRKTQLQVTIIVDDVNNHAPEWDSSSPTFRIPETKNAGAIVAVVRATDKDAGKNSDLTFSIESNTNGSLYFDVRNGDTPGQAELFIKKNLTGYPGTYMVDVIATDGGDEPRNATLEVLVIVEDINLDPPVFLRPNASTYNISAGVLPQIYVSEGGIHTMQYKLDAEDEGKGTRVFYTLTPSTVFRVNGNGVITNVVPLDRETKDSYKIRVKAEDNGLPAPLSTTLDLIISVTDKNDSDPVYNTRDNVLTTQTMSVIEEVMNPTIGLVKRATDPDLVAHICYYLCDGQDDHLILDKRNRSLSLVGKVDRENVTKVTEFITVNVFASSDCDPEASRNCSDVKKNAQLKITVNVEDVDDNPPRFTPTHIFSRAIPYDKQVNYEVINLKDFVKDPDASPNNEYTFQLKDSTLSPEMKTSFKGSNPFRVLRSGSVLTNTVLQADLVGYFKLNIEVNGVQNPTFKDEAEVKIYIVANEQRVRLVFSKLPGEVNATIDPLMQSLAKVLDLNITVGAIQTHTNADGKPDNSKTDAFIYANKKNSDDFMSGTELQRVLDYNSKAKLLLFKYGVLEAKLLSTKEDGDDNEVMNRLFVILVTVLSILVIGLLLVLLNIIRMYRRRLKAATTMAYVSPKQQEMYEHPGTNKYYTAENPLFGKEIKAPEIEEDRNSTNSLDVNAVDKSPAKTAYYNNIDPDEEQEVVLQITDSSLSSPHHNGYDQAANQNTRLSKVLEEYDNSVNNNNNKNSSSSSSKTKPPPPPPTSLDNNQGKAYGIPGLGQDVQEAVTRFSDDGGSRSKSNGYPGTIHEFSSSHGNLEYTEI